MIELNKNFVSGQVTCPVCKEVMHARGVLGTLRYVPSHKNCKGAGMQVILDNLSDKGAKAQCDDYFNLIESIKKLEQ